MSRRVVQGLVVVVGIAAVAFWWSARPRAPIDATVATEATATEDGADGSRGRDEAADPSRGDGADRRASSAVADSDRDRADGDDVAAAKPSGNWVVDMLRPRPGEDFLAYRDRVLPIAQAVVAPQRRRVRRNYDALTAELDADTRKDVAAILDRSQDQLKNRILGAVVGGELDPSSMRPIDGVVFARDVLDVVVTADTDLRERLGADAALMDGAGFDVVDYLAFATRWEDILFVTDDAM